MPTPRAMTSLWPRTASTLAYGAPFFWHGGQRAALLSDAGWRFVTTNPGVDCWSVWSGPAGTLLLIPVDAERVYGYASATKGGPVDTDQQWLRLTFNDYPEPVHSAVSSVLAEDVGYAS